MSKFFCMLFAATLYIKFVLCEDELIKLSVVFRHGNRMPTDFDYPNNPYYDVEFNPPAGSLIEEGKEAAQRLGNTLRNQYNTFLGTYDKNQFRAICSPIQRCKDTFKHMIETLYPSNTNNVICSTAENGKDKLIATFDSCPDVLDVSQYPLYIEDSKFVTILNGIIGMNITNYMGLWQLDNYLNVMEEIGYTKPGWAKSLSREIEFLGKKYLNMVNQKQGVNYAGNLLHKIAGESNGIKLKLYPKVNLYSGHDINIVTLLGLLGAYYDDDIHYCSYISFEVYKQSQGPNYVQIYLSNNGQNRTQILIPGCMEKCPVLKFLEFAEQFYAGEEWCT